VIEASTEPQMATVDSLSAHELLKQATRLASTSDLSEIGRLLQDKHVRFAESLSPGSLERLDAEALQGLLGLVFSVRSRRRALLREQGASALRDSIARLLWGDDAYGVRFSRFVSEQQTLDRRRARALASELLHFTDPSRYWLWTHWIWDPEAESGVLRLLTDEEGAPSRSGADEGLLYQLVCTRSLSVYLDGRKSGYIQLAEGSLGADAFFAVVYSVYMLTLYRLKLSENFDRFLPRLPELARRLLGVQHLPNERA